MSELILEYPKSDWVEKERWRVAREGDSIQLWWGTLAHGDSSYYDELHFEWPVNTAQEIAKLILEACEQADREGGDE